MSVEILRNGNPNKRTGGRSKRGGIPVPVRVSLSRKGTVITALGGPTLSILLRVNYPENEKQCKEVDERVKFLKYKQRTNK